jgi:hypothetical protein
MDVYLKTMLFAYFLILFLAIRGTDVHFYTMKAHNGSRGIVPHLVNISVRWK